MLSVTRQKPRRWPTLVVAVVVSVGAGLVAVRISPDAKSRVKWDAASGAAVPAEFLIAMVPKSSSVPLYDAPNGVKIGVLDRAMLNTWDEVQQGAWFTLAGSAPRPLVIATDMKFADSENDRAWLLALDAAARKGLVIHDARSIRVNFESRADRVDAEVIIDRRRFTEIFEYGVLGGHAVPKVMKNFGVVDEIEAEAVALGNGAIATVATAGGIWMILRWLRRRPVPKSQ